MAGIKAPKGFHQCYKCKKIIPNGKCVCGDCAVYGQDKVKSLPTVDEDTIIEKKIRPSAVYPGEGCGYTWGEWYVVTWRALRKSAAKQWGIVYERTP